MKSQRKKTTTNDPIKAIFIGFIFFVSLFIILSYLLFKAQIGSKAAGDTITLTTSNSSGKFIISAKASSAMNIRGYDFRVTFNQSSTNKITDIAYDSFATVSNGLGSDNSTLSTVNSSGTVKAVAESRNSTGTPLSTSNVTILTLSYSGSPTFTVSSGGKFYKIDSTSALVEVPITVNNGGGGVTGSPTRTPTRTPTSGNGSPTRTPTRTPTSGNGSPTRTPTRTPTSGNGSPTRTPTRTPTSGNGSPTRTPTRTPTSGNGSPTRTPSPTKTPTPGGNQPTNTPTPVNNPTSTPIVEPSPTPNNTGCSTNNDCADNEVCRSGVCAGVSCPASVPMCKHIVAANHVCSLENDPDGSSCGTNGTCQNGSCVESNNPTPTQPQNVSPTQPAGNIMLALKLKFQGIIKKPDDRYNLLKVKVTVAGGPSGREYTQSQVVDFRADSAGVWTGTAQFNSPSGSNYRVFVKGPKHLQKRICDSRPTETYGGTYRCSEVGNVTLASGTNNLDFSGILQMVGDLPDQNGIVDSYDIAYLRTNLGATDPKAVATADLNLDGIVDSQDYSLLIASLSIKYDEL